MPGKTLTKIRTRVFLGFSQPALSSGLHNDGRGQFSSPSPFDSNNDLGSFPKNIGNTLGLLPPSSTPSFQDDRLTNVHSGTTPIPLGFVTTRRPFNATPRVKSNINMRKKNRGGSSKFKTTQQDSRGKFALSHQLPPSNQQNDQNDRTHKTITEDPRALDPFNNPPFVSVDGKKPRVKANINSKQINRINSITKSNNRRKHGSRKVELERSQFKKIDFISPTPRNEGTQSPFLAPELRPDGRLPRVKANILAANKGQGQQIKSSPHSFEPFVTTKNPTLHLPDTFSDNDLPANQIDLSPTTKSFAPFDSNFDPTPPTVSEINNGGTLEPLFPQTPRFPFRAQTPNNFGFSTTPRSHNDLSTTFSNQRPSTSRIISNSPTPPSFPPSRNFKLGPPPQPKIPLFLQRNRNRFGMRPKTNLGESERKSSNNNFNPISRGKKTDRPVKFKTPNDIINEIDENQGKCLNPFKCPPRRVAGGRKPRVKSNIKARRRNFWNPRKSRVIKRRKLLKERKFNAKLWANVRPNQRTGRKQSSIKAEDDIITGNEIDVTESEKSTTTIDPISSLQHIVESKVNKNELFTSARKFQNRKIKPKQKISRKSNFVNDLTTEKISAPVTVPSTTQTTTELTTSVSLFVTNPNFLPTITIRSNSIVPEKIATTPRIQTTTPITRRSFTTDDMGLFVTNPRALPHHGNENIMTKIPKIIDDGKKPRVKSDIMARFKNRPNIINHISSTSSPSLQMDEVINEVPVLRIKPDGRQPRVKSDIENRKKNKKKGKTKGRTNFKNNWHRFHSRIKSRKNFARSLNLESRERKIKNGVNDFDDYDEPEVRPDGRKPRVKSNIKAKGKKTKKLSKQTLSNSYDELSDQEDITTFRPVKALEMLIPNNGTLTPRDLTVPLPNIENVSKAPQKGVFSQQEPSFSDLSNANQVDQQVTLNTEIRDSVHSATEIVTLTKKDHNLFSRDFNYEDYYYDQINDTSDNR